MLEKYEEIAFANLLSLERFKRVPIGYNFECPFCREGKSHGRKRRGFLLINSPRHNHVRFFCHNCHRDLSLKAFLKEHNIGLYEEYVEKEKENRLLELQNGKRKKRGNRIEINTDVNPPNYIHLETRYFRPIWESQQALAYCQQRKISERIIQGLYYVHKDVNVPQSMERKIAPLRGMVVFPFYHNEKIYGFQGRSISGKTFHTHSQPGYKVYNLFGVDRNRTVYIFESIIDSIFIDNSIAMLGASFSDSTLASRKITDRVFCLDNEFNPDTLNRMQKLVEQGERVVIWPETNKWKDVNKMITDGHMTREQIINTINENIYEGFEAQTKIGLLKYIKKRK